MEYKITALTLVEMQDLIDDGTFSSCFQSSLPQLKHATKPTYNWDHLTGDLLNDNNMYDEIKGTFINTSGWDSHRIQKITEKPDGGVERIIALRVGYYGPTQHWIDDGVDQSNFYWAHVELTRNDGNGSKSWIYDPDFLKIEGPFYKALGITNWKMLMVPNTDYTDSITTQANLRLNSDSFKTPIWSDLDITYNSRDFAIKHNAKAENEDFQLDLNVHPDTDITNSWKNLEFNI